jgi:hypothetical protein
MTHDKTIKAMVNRKAISEPAVSSAFVILSERAAIK